MDLQPHAVTEAMAVELPKPASSITVLAVASAC